MTREKDDSKTDLFRSSSVRRSSLIKEMQLDPNLRGLFQSDAASEVDPSELRRGDVDPVLPADVFTAAPAPRNLLQAHEVSAAVDRHLRSAAVKASSIAGDFLIGRVRAAVHLDNDPVLPAEKVHEVRTDRRLPYKLQAAKLAIAQLSPEFGFGRDGR